ncbi:2Fe-2S iron-sulfur cluster-binding protein [Brevibacillus choshinensis]|uniref:(2Fe-2S)-binding protein n=1 Tax=Brevibacillus choshinensis TaxID=54911 RepID=A0ABX7FMH7_BRECH|nr:2Fe-2S iron-sulfur cluster-binding protein [Brevibacillus choshinensis]QRG67459.1 (2Fe-2S)-binding protein [Brevibacillus choshinensis]
MRKPLTVGSLIPGRSIPSQPQITSLHTSPAPVAKKNGSSSTSRQQNVQHVRVKQRDQVFQVRAVPRETILSAALAQGQAIEYKCQQGQCGKCAVQLIEGSSCLSSPGNQEKDKLGSKLSQGYRLACQSTFRSMTQNS